MSGQVISFVLKFQSNIMYMVLNVISILITAVLASLLFGDALTFFLIMGCLLVALSCYLMFRKNLAAEKAHQLAVANKGDEPKPAETEMSNPASPLATGRTLSSAHENCSSRVHVELHSAREADDASTAGATPRLPYKAATPRSLALDEVARKPSL